MLGRLPDLNLPGVATSESPYLKYTYLYGFFSVAWDFLRLGMFYSTVYLGCFVLEAFWGLRCFKA
jgi:hypothetical protein